MLYANHTTIRFKKFSYSPLRSMENLQIKEMLGGRETVYRFSHTLVDNEMTILTVDVELHNLADGGRDPVLGHTHVGTHLAPGDAVQVQHLTPHLHT